MIDVLIVGGSVAGSACALHLARQGRRVVVLERAQFPRRKACGEGLFPAGVRELRALGVLGRLTGYAQLEALRFHGYGQIAEARLGAGDERALGIRREVLDAALLRAAEDAGAEVRFGVRALGLGALGPQAYAVRTAQGNVEARVIVAADGLHSALRREAGLDHGRGEGSRFGISAHIELAQDTDPVVDVYFRPGFEVYVTPVGGRGANVAVLLSRPMTAAFAGDANRAFDALLVREGVLAHGWRHLDDALMAGPFPARARGLWSRNLVLVGDATGFFDGITGEGISLALVSARHCAEAVDAFLSASSTAPFAAYERRRKALARNSEALGRLTLAFAARPWVARRALRNLARHPDAFTRLVAVSAGEAGLRSVRPSDVFALLTG